MQYHLPFDLLMGRLPLILHVMEVIGVLAFAVSGVVDARKQRLDVVGTFVVAFATAFGGGTCATCCSTAGPSTGWTTSTTSC
jgi:uncharacterized membrane protein YeiH